MPFVVWFLVALWLRDCSTPSDLGPLAGDPCPICRGKIQTLGRHERGVQNKPGTPVFLTRSCWPFGCTVVTLTFVDLIVGQVNSIEGMICHALTS